MLKSGPKKCLAPVVVLGPLNWDVSASESSSMDERLPDVTGRLLW